MDKTNIIESLKKLRTEAKKRKFSQRFDLVVNLKDLNMKDPANQLDIFVLLHYSNGRKPRFCALVGSELKEEAEKNCDKVIHEQEFAEYAKDKKKAKNVAESHDYFIAQANIMGKAAGAFGRILGPRKKMPNPKAGCVVPPKANLAPLIDKLQKTSRVYAKERPLVQCSVGSEEMKDEEIADNILTLYDRLIHSLPGEKNNIKTVFLKLTMSKAIELAK